MKIRERLKKVFTPQVVIILLLIIATIVVTAIFFGPQLVDLFSNTDRIKSLVKSAGPFGPILFGVLQILQIIFAPIPGNVTGALGGVLFGWWGLPLTIVSTAIGVTIVANISRRFGRPLIERFFSKKEIDKYGFLVGRKAELALFLIFLIPFGPSDMASYLAGLTGARLRNIVIISTIGRLPGQIVLNFFGNQVYSDSPVWFIIVLAATAAIGVVFYLKRHWMQELFKAEDHWLFIKESLKRKNDE